MVLNIILKTLSEEEKKIIKSIGHKDSLKNISFLGEGKKFKTMDIVSEEREILINANIADQIFFFGFFNDEYLQLKVAKSLIARENTKFVCSNDEEVERILNIEGVGPSIKEKLRNSIVINFQTKFEGYKDFPRVEDALDTIVKTEKKKEIRSSIKEIKENAYMINKMAVAQFKESTLNTSLGNYWYFVRDVMFFFTYVLFMLFIRGNNPIDGLPAVLYLMAGLVSWYFVSDILSGGANCIKESKGIISKVKFPIAIIPIYSTLSIFYRRALTYIILGIVVVIYKVVGTPGLELHPLQFIYYTVSMFILMLGVNILFSSFVAVSRDFSELYKSIVRIQMYFFPIFWDIRTVNAQFEKFSFPGIEVMQGIFKVAMLNPIVYILNGYRASLGAYVYNGYISTIVFWLAVIVIYFIGLKMQYKLRSIYADII